MNQHELIKYLDALPLVEKRGFIEKTLAEHPEFNLFVLRKAQVLVQLREFKKARDFIYPLIDKTLPHRMRLVASDLELKDNNPSKAEQHIEYLLTNHADNEHTHIMNGRLAILQDRHDQAICSYHKAIEINPESIGGNCQLADFYLTKNKIEKALCIIENAVKLSPNSFFFLNKQGHIYKQSEQFEDAIIAFKHALKSTSNPIHAANLALQISVCRSTNYNDEFIIKELKIFIYEHPKHIGLRNRLTNYLFNIGKRKESFEQAELVLKIDSKNISALLHKAKVLFHNGSITKAYAACKNALAIHPNNIHILLLKSSILRNEQKFEEALIVLNDINNIEPKNPTVLLYKAQIVLHLKEIENAKNLCEKVLILKPNWVHGILLKAKILIEQNLIKETFNTYKKAIELHSKIDAVYVQAANFLYLQGESKKALSVLNRGLKLLPNSKNILYRAVQINLNLGNYTQASKIIKDLYSIYPEQLQVYYFHMQLLQSQGNFEEALKIADLLKSKSNIDQIWNSKVNTFIANTAFLDYDYKKAESIFRDLAKENKFPSSGHNRLALLKILRGDVEGAMAQLRTATIEAEASHQGGKMLVPLIGHVAKVINEFRINPFLLEKLRASLKLDKEKKIQTIANIVSKNPSYFGASLYLVNELRSQGILVNLASSIESANTAGVIPKIITQYWNDDIPPREIRNVMQTWSKLNPDYQYKSFSRRSAHHFIKENYSPAEEQAFLNCEHPAMQADFFRLAFLAAKGGFYADADDKCLQPLDQLIDKGSDLILKLGDFGCFANNFLACSANNPLIKYTFERGTQNMLTYFNEGPWFRLGPGHLTSCMAYQLSKFTHEPNLEKWPKLYTLNQSEARKIFSQHLPLSYKKTDRSWFSKEYKRNVSKTKSA